MCSRLEELRNKQVVCVHTGEVLGYIGDIEFDIASGKMESLIIYGEPRSFGLFGKTQDIVIPWSDIAVIGSQTVLVKNKTEFFLRV